MEKQTEERSEQEQSAQKRKLMSKRRGGLERKRGGRAGVGVLPGGRDEAMSTPQK